MKQNNNISFNFESKKVLVIGGSKGIGKEVCKQFVDSGALVYSVSRTSCNLNKVINIKCDISKTSDIDMLFKKVKEVDFCINVAGTNLCEQIENISESEWDRVLDVNLKSFYKICKKVISIMKLRNGGRIVNVSSIAGRSKSLVSGVHYTASKYGIIGLTKQLSKEVSKDNILVNCLCPSQTLTEMLEASMTKEEQKNLENTIPIGRIASPKEQALPILFLCSSAASYITGSTLDVNGGQL
tara:strand:+ start:460 stop:1182 length:723 start_codon:yes stop_codon:yes gene_type:complete